MVHGRHRVGRSVLMVGVPFIDGTNMITVWPLRKNARLLLFIVLFDGVTADNNSVVRPASVVRLSGQVICAGDGAASFAVRW